MESCSYRGMVCHRSLVVQDFYASDTLSAIAKLSRLIEEEYPNAHGQILDLSNNKIIYQCRHQIDY